MESLDHAILLTLNQKSVIDNLKKMIEDKRMWLGPAAGDVSVTSEEKYSREEGELLAAFKIFKEKMEAYRNHVAEREMRLNQIHRSLQNPSETGQIVIRGKRHRNCFDALTPEITQLLLRRLAVSTENDKNSAMQLRKEMFFFDAGMVLSAAKPLWGGIGAALLNRSLGTIVFGSGVLCTAKDTDGTVVALVRVDPAVVVAAEAESGNIRWRLEAGIVQNRDGSYAPDMATMAFEKHAEFYVVNKKRFVCFNGRCTATTLNAPKVAGNTIRINRFINNVPNRPFYIQPPSFAETQTEAPPFYVKGHHGQGFVTLQVNARDTRMVFPDLSKRCFYRPESVSYDPAGPDPQAAPKFSNAFQDQISVRRANILTVFFSVPSVINVGPKKIDAVARLASFLFVSLEGERDLRIVCLPQNVYRISSVLAYPEGGVVHAVVVADASTEQDNVTPVTIFAKLERTLTVATDIGTKEVPIQKLYSALSAVLDTEARKNISALEKLGLKTKIMKKFEDSIVAKPVALTVKNYWSGIVRGQADDAYVQCGTALIRLAPGLV